LGKCEVNNAVTFEAFEKLRPLNLKKEVAPDIIRVC